MIVGVQNLMWQLIHLFYRLEIVETMRAYIAHNMDKNEDLLASLEMTKSEATAAWKFAKEEDGLLRKTEEEEKVVKVEARWLAEEKEVMAINKKKAEE